jgi:hypothetical protein
MLISSSTMRKIADTNALSNTSACPFSNSSHGRTDNVDLLPVSFLYSFTLEASFTVPIMTLDEIIAQYPFIGLLKHKVVSTRILVPHPCAFIHVDIESASCERLRNRCRHGTSYSHWSSAKQSSLHSRLFTSPFT